MRDRSFPLVLEPVLVFFPLRLLLLVPFLLALARCGGEGRLVAEPDVIDFGRVLSKDVKVKLLLLRNEGHARVLVTDVIPNCVCFEVLPFRRSIEPGETRELKVRFHSDRVPAAKLRGKKLDIITDDPKAGRMVVKLEGTPFRAYAVTPPKLELDFLDESGRTRSWTIEVRSVDANEVEVGPLTALPDDVLALDRVDRARGVDIKVRIKEDAPDGTGRLKGWISVPIELILPDGSRRRIRETVQVGGDWP